MIPDTLGRSPWSVYESMSLTRLVRGGRRRVGRSPLTASESSTDCLTILGEGFQLVHPGACGSVAVDPDRASVILPGRRSCWRCSATSWKASWEHLVQSTAFDLMTGGDHDVPADLSSLHRHGIQFRALLFMGHVGNGYSTLAS